MTAIRKADYIEAIKAMRQQVVEQSYA